LCILYSVFCILYSVLCTLNSVLCFLYSVFCILYSVVYVVSLHGREFQGQPIRIALHPLAVWVGGEASMYYFYYVPEAYLTYLLPPPPPHLFSFALKFLFLQTHTTSHSFCSVLLYTVKEKGGKPDRKTHPLPYGFRNPSRNLKSENSQDYAQKPQRYCTFMNSALKNTL
jgi:hypothetical protein